MTESATENRGRWPALWIAVGCALASPIAAEAGWCAAPSQSVPTWDGTGSLFADGFDESIVCLIWSAVVGLVGEPQSFNYGAPSPCGLTLGCTSFALGIPGSCDLAPKYIDGTVPAIPSVFRVVQVKVRIHGYRAGDMVTVTPSINGEIVATATDTLPSTSDCDCSSSPACDFADFTSTVHDRGWPEWNYIEPNSNQLQIDVTAPDGGIAVEFVQVFLGLDCG